MSALAGGAALQGEAAGARGPEPAPAAWYREVVISAELLLGPTAANYRLEQAQWVGNSPQKCSPDPRQNMSVGTSLGGPEPGSIVWALQWFT